MKFLRLISIVFTAYALPTLVVNILWLSGVFGVDRNPFWVVAIIFSSFVVALFTSLCIPMFFNDVWYKEQKGIDQYKRDLSELKSRWLNKLNE